MAQQIKWSRDAFRQIRTDPKVDADMQRRARAVAAAAGDGYEAVRTDNPRSRARAAVITATGKAMRDNARNQTLLRSIWAGR